MGCGTSSSQTSGAVQGKGKKAQIEADIKQMIITEQEPKRIIEGCISNDYLYLAEKDGQGLSIPIDKVCLNVDEYLNPNKVFRTLKYFSKIGHIPWLGVSFKFIVKDQLSVFDTAFELLFQNLTRYNDTLYHLQLDFKGNKALAGGHLGKLGAHLITKINLRSLSFNLLGCESIDNAGFGDFMDVLASQPGINALELIKLNIRGTPLTAEKGLVHLKKVYKTFMKSLTQIEVVHTDECHPLVDCFKPEPPNADWEWKLGSDYSKKKTWSLTKVIKKTKKQIAAEKEMDLNEERKKKDENIPKLFEVLNEDHRKVSFSDKFGKLLNPIKGVEIHWLDEITETILRHYKDLTTRWVMKDVGADTEKTAKKMAKLMNASENMKLFYLEVKDKTFNGDHLVTLGKVIEKRGDIEKVHLIIHDSKGIGDGALKTFLESMRKTPSLISEFAFRFDEKSTRTDIVRGLEAEFKKKFGDSIKFEIKEGNKKKDKNHDDGLSIDQRRSMQSKFKSKKYEKKRNW